jgi:hypothetical protein
MASAREQGLLDGRLEGRADGYAAGREEGLAEGHARGLAEGRAEGREEGLAEGREEAPADPALEAELADAFRAIDAARSLSEILDALTTAVGRQATRMALLLVRGTELRAWRAVGLGSDITALRLDRSGLARDAVRMRAAVSADAASDPAHSVPAFVSGQPSDDMLAVPLVVGGEVVAVVYADQGPPGANGRRPARSWRTAVELVTRHASRSLEAVTAFRTAQLFVSPESPPGSGAAPDGSTDDGQDAARRYARLLILEIKMDHEHAVAEGRRERDLTRRLGGEIARARVLYEQRVPASVRSASNYFHDELVRTLAGGDESLVNSGR